MLYNNVFIVLLFISSINFYKPLLINDDKHMICFLLFESIVLISLFFPMTYENNIVNLDKIKHTENNKKILNIID